MSFFSGLAWRIRSVSVDWSLTIAALIALGLASGAFIKSGFGETGPAMGLRLEGVSILTEADRLISSEDFARGAPGWIGGTTDESAVGFGGILGRFGGTGGEEAVSRTYEIDPARSHVVISFDLHAIDDWALEEIVVFINGTPVTRRSFSTRPDLMADQMLHVEELAHVDVEMTVDQTSSRHRGFVNGGPATEDQTVHVRITAETPGEILRIGFGSTLAGGIETASWAVDNVQIISTDAPR